MIPESQEEKRRWELTMLHQLLENVNELGPETKDAIQLVAADIERLLGEKKDQDKDEETEKDEWSSVGKRWRDAVLEFESHHPRLTQAVDQVSGMLANAGI